MICYFLITKLFHLTLFIYFKEEKKLSLPLVNSLFVLFTYMLYGASIEKFYVLMLSG